MYNNCLTHFGIPGMKWGVRRIKSQLSRDGGHSKKGSAKEDAHNDHKKVRDSKSVRGMSDSELRDRINRLQMERQYSSLTKRETSAGAKFIKNVLVGAAQQTVSKYVSRYMTNGADALIKKVMGK
ncbi:MAG: hypothetical protein LBR74_00540 [Eubacterium sp.]|jgi:hypothetical protein|nr:hypothetical protein [Eubacterium sp.]